MDVRTFRADTMREALALVRRELGSEALVVGTREVRGGLLGWFSGRSGVEIAAAAGAPCQRTPSRIPTATPRATLAPVDAHGLDLQAYRPTPAINVSELPESLFRLYAELIEAELDEPIVNGLIEMLSREVLNLQLATVTQLKAQLIRSLKKKLRISGPIRVSPQARRLVALVGPTGVGKTTTIAKLAAHFKLTEQRSVGLITVDTFRIAAIEQLRTYADIIDLPMEVVSDVHEMRAAVRRLGEMDLVLLDTAGRSPRDRARIDELKEMLAVAEPDDVQLVLSATASLNDLSRAADRFAEVGATNLMITKLDEAHSLGNLLPLVERCQLPISYLTNGQGVPDDIEAATSERLARLVLGMDRGVADGH